LSAASIYPFNKSHSTHTPWWWNWGNGLYHRRRRWHGLRLCMVIVPQHTQIYILSCARLSCVVVVGRLVGHGWSCVCFVWGCCVHTPGIAVCAAAAAALLAAPLHREAAAHGMARAQFNYAVFVRGRDLSYLWCVCVCLAHTHTHPRHHQLSPTPARMHMSSRACIPKVICVYDEHGTVCTPLLQHTLI
jgi:hypothetical protein